MRRHTQKLNCEVLENRLMLFAAPCDPGDADADITTLPCSEVYNPMAVVAEDPNTGDVLDWGKGVADNLVAHFVPSHPFQFDGQTIVQFSISNDGTVELLPSGARSTNAAESSELFPLLDVTGNVTGGSEHVVLSPTNSVVFVNAGDLDASNVHVVSTDTSTQITYAVGPELTPVDFVTVELFATNTVEWRYTATGGGYTGGVYRQNTQAAETFVSEPGGIYQSQSPIVQVGNLFDGAVTTERRGGTLIIRGSENSDSVGIWPARKPGYVIVQGLEGTTVDGHERIRVRVPQAIRAVLGGGDDSFTVRGNVASRVDVFAGAGADQIRAIDAALDTFRIRGQGGFDSVVVRGGAIALVDLIAERERRQ